MYDKARGAGLAQITDYFLCGVEAVKENKQHYEAAEAHLQLRPQPSMGRFMRSFMRARTFTPEQDGD